jgi:uncharacterized membrane protein (TIGR02234 family)
MTALKREYATAVLLLAVGAALILFAASRDWLTLTVPRAQPLAPLQRSVHGSSAQPALTAIGIVGLAGIVAVVATRRWGRMIVGVALLAAAVLVIVETVRDLAGVSAARAESLLEDSGPVVGVAPGQRPVADVHAGWAAAVIIGGLLVGVAGALVAARGRRWPAMGSRYERAVSGSTAPSANADAPEARQRATRRLWDALDRGEDPTAERPESAAMTADERRQAPDGGRISPNS